MGHGMCGGGVEGKGVSVCVDVVASNCAHPLGVLSSFSSVSGAGRAACSVLAFAPRRMRVTDPTSPVFAHLQFARSLQKEERCGLMLLGMRLRIFTAPVDLVLEVGQGVGTFDQSLSGCFPGPRSGVQRPSAASLRRWS